MANHGFVYILSNLYMPDLIKIGCTERSPHARADELSKATGVPTPFQVMCYAEFEDFQSQERSLHGWLNHSRVNDSREFFEGVLRDAVRWLWHHPNRLAFCDATVGRIDPPWSELSMRVCSEPHELKLADTESPFTAHNDVERVRIPQLVAQRCLDKARALEVPQETPEDSAKVN